MATEKEIREQLERMIKTVGSTNRSADDMDDVVAAPGDPCAAPDTPLDAPDTPLDAPDTPSDAE